MIIGVTNGYITNGGAAVSQATECLLALRTWLAHRPN